jgi:FkbM family methyltransferase
MPGIAQTLKRLYRRNAQRYPALFNTQQRYSVLVKSWLTYAHEADFRALPLLGLPSDALCIDVGGNRGQSITSIKSALPGARIVSFEPNPTAFETLQTIARRFPDVAVHNCALGDGSDDILIYLPHCGGIVFDQLAAMEKPDIAEMAKIIRSFGFTFASENNLGIERLAAPMRLLDQLVLRPDFIKIDVEGAELRVLRGAVRILDEDRPALLIEHGDREEIEDFLSRRGYRGGAFIDGVLSFNGEAAGLNRFFVHESRLPLPYRRPQ